MESTETIIITDKVRRALEDKMDKEEVIDQLHQRFMNDMVELFDKYKAAAGYSNATLELL